MGLPDIKTWAFPTLRQFLRRPRLGATPSVTRRTERHRKRKRWKIASKTAIAVRPTLELFERQHQDNFWERRQSAYGLSKRVDVTGN